MTQVSTATDERTEDKQTEEGKSLRIDLGKLPKMKDSNGVKISKITLRKNSVRRRIAHPE